MNLSYIGLYNSSLKNITCGIPQGSVIRSMLFLLYSNNSGQINTSKSDDTTIKKLWYNFKTLQNVIVDDYTHIKKRQSLNTVKRQSLIF